MYNILKRADRRAKRTKVWDSGTTDDAWFIEFGLGSLGALCKISNFMIFKTLFLSQFLSDFKQMLAMTFIGNLPKITNNMALKIWHPKMCNILKMTNRRVKRMKNLGLVVLCTVLSGYVGYFSCLILWVQLRSFGALCKRPDVNIFKRLLLPQFSFNFIQSLYRESM